MFKIIFKNRNVIQNATIFLIDIYPEQILLSIQQIKQQIYFFNVSAKLPEIFGQKTTKEPVMRSTFAKY